MLSMIILAVTVGGLAGDFGGYGGGYGVDHGGDHTMISSTITRHHVKEPVISYVAKPVHTLDHGYKAVYTVSYKPIVISHGYSYPVKKSSLGLSFHKGGDSY